MNKAGRFLSVVAYFACDLKGCYGTDFLNILQQRYGTVIEKARQSEREKCDALGFLFQV